MIKEVNQYKKLFKQSYKQAISEIKQGKIETDWINNIFPQIHGINLSKEKNKENFNNIVEAREFLNDKTISKSLIEICNILYKIESNNILDLFNKNDSLKFKSSLTLFNYITNPNIKSLLIFRNYDKKITSKFNDNKQYGIFKKLLTKFYNDEEDITTLLIIENETFLYSQKEIILKDIDKCELSLAEDVLIKYSETAPIISEGLKENSTITEKKFCKNLSNEEYTIFCKFNIDNKTVKKIRMTKYKAKERIVTGFVFILLLTSSITILSLKESTPLIIPHEEIALNKLSNPIKEDDNFEKEVKEEPKENDKLQVQEEIKENETTPSVVQDTIEPSIEPPAPVEEPKPQPVVTSYSYVTPTGVGNEDMVNIALGQVGNVGGQPFWSWYGFSSHVAWCGCFVSWVANQAGISENTIPKFSRVPEGINWFINKQLFRDRNYTPRAGDLIFFDYDFDGNADHVGIVKTVSGGRVYTIEGNVKQDQCKELSYSIGNDSIYGYGTPNY